MKGQAVYDCKAKCEELGKCCHNTKNRCIEKMCQVEKEEWVLNETLNISEDDEGGQFSFTIVNYFFCFNG